MKRLLAASITVLSCCVAVAQSSGPPVTKVAITSLVGDAISVDVYRRRVGTHIDTNQRETLPIPDPHFDEMAMETVASALAKSLPSVQLAKLSVPRAGTDLDPAQFLVDGRIAASHRMVVALRDAGFTHLLVVAKHRAPARLQMVGSSVGSGHLSGLGFYVDSTYSTMRTDTLESAKGFIAPYVYIRLGLVDLASLQQVRERTITEGIVRSAARNKEGLDAWGAMTAEEKVAMLQDLLRNGLQDAVPLLLTDTAPR
jgi:hypothetical protein